MKKTILALMIMMTLFMMTACGGGTADNQGGGDAPEPSDEPVESTDVSEDALAFPIDDTVLTFDIDDSIESLHYKSSYELEQNWGSYKNPIYYSLIYSGPSYFEIRMEFDSGDTLDDMIEECTEGEFDDPDLNALKEQTTEINGLTWHYFTHVDDEHRWTEYWYEGDDGLYNITFFTRSDTALDLDELAEVFFNGVTF